MYINSNKINPKVFLKIKDMKVLYTSFIVQFRFYLLKTKLGKADELFKKILLCWCCKAYEECLRFKRPLKGLRTLEILFYFISDNRNALRWYEKLYKKKRWQVIRCLFFLRYIQTMKSESRFNSNTASLLTRARLDLKADQNELNRFLVQEKYLDSIAKQESLYY
jgi:hypothetical protein